MTSKHDLEHRPERPILPLVNWQRIPEVMKPFDQWTYWHYEWRVDRDKGTGKWIKRPKFYDPDAPPGCRFQKAAVNDPDTFMSYDLAKRVVDFGEAHGKQVGLMFMLTAEDPLVVLDFDDCRNPKTGQIAPDVAEILRNLDTYTEISPSQTGVKTYLLGKKPGDRCSRSGSPIQVEIYEKGRPLAVTGDTLQWLPQVLMPRQEQLNDLYNYIFPPPPPRPPVPDMGYVPRSCPELPDDEMLQAARMARNGDRFEALWAGDSSGYRSCSEGDFALAFRLAFWVGPDQARIENLLWQSGRVRDKWHKRPHYVRDTVAKAIAQQTHHYGDARPDPIAAELAGIDWSRVEEVCSAPPAPTPPPPPPSRPPILPLTTPCDTDGDLARLLNRSYYDHERYFCPHVQRHMLEDRRTGNPIEILKRCGKCPTCIRRRIDAILARVRHQLADLDRQGIPYFECVSPRACWEALRKRMQRAGGDSLRYHRMASPDENYVVNTAGEGIQTTAEHVLCELEARLHEHFHGPRVFYSCHAWEEVNLAEREKHCDYRFPVDEIDATTVHEIASTVEAYIEVTLPRDATTETQAVRVFKRSGGWSNEQLAHFYAMIRAGEVLPDSAILDYDPDDHGHAHNGGWVHGPGAAGVFSQDNSG